ncbi:Spindle and kinetochore-associated protein 1 [Liparis tanakae]|uniref:SKA complex subunit 1 n=1 Tax=Liparis tanakae TaxID=230148 RepID=A0A4Z2F3B8_9TELE|nr:Spindle and kinetochore-associated protein 1 [Liparis tanakae]
MSELQDISQHIEERLSSLHRMLELSAVELPQRKKLTQELATLEKLLEEFEKCVGRQKEQLEQLKELEELFQKNVQDVQHLEENIPAHMPRKTKGPASRGEPLKSQKETADVQPAQPEHVKRTTRIVVREVEVITVPEFESIPSYMKGRVSYHQLNVAVQSINAALSAKYKILHQGAKTLSNQTRKLQQRFKSEETKETKGQFFVVEDDIREFTQMKTDKRFQGILNMLRHCQRLRELRGGKVTRYLLL